MSVAIVCDWLITYTGYERVIESEQQTARIGNFPRP